MIDKFRAPYIFAVAILSLPFSFVAVAQDAGHPKSTKPRFEQLDESKIQFDVTPFYDRSPAPPPKPELGPIDKWRYQSCQQDAATAPTSQGVVVKLRICREKFGQ